MKKRAIKLVVPALIAILAVFVLSGVETVSNDANMTLQAGKTYEFVNQDKQSTHYINSNVENGAVAVGYDYVYKDESQTVVSFGSASGRFSVSAGGSSLITLTDESDMDILYPADHISIREVATAVLHRTKIESGKTMRIANRDADKLYHISLDSVLRTLSPKYDSVYRDMSGNATRYAKEDSYTGVTIPEGGSVLITADNDLELCMPSEWLWALTLQSSGDPALYFYAVKAGGTIRIANNGGETAYDLTADGAGTSSPKYDYIYKDNGGKVLSYGNARIFRNFSVEKGGETVITAGSSYDMQIWFPYEWKKNGLAITTQSSPALYFYTLGSGNSIEISNTDMGSAYPIANNSSSLSMAPKFDYVYRDMNQKATQYGNENLFDSFMVDYGGSTVITAKNGYDLKIWMPNEWMTELTVKPVEGPALYIHNVTARKSLLVQNSDLENIYSVSTNSLEPEREASPQLDYVYKDISGHAIDYGNGGLNNTFMVAGGGSTQIYANNGYRVKVWMPYEWRESLSFSETDAPALSVYYLAPGKTFAFVSADEEKVYQVASNSDDGVNAPRYDYVNKDAGGRVRTYGCGSRETHFEVDKGGSTLVTADSSYKLKVWFPYEWQDEVLTVEEHPDPALYHHTLAASMSAKIQNLDQKYEYALATDSTAATASPKYDYVLKDAANIVTAYGSANLFESFSIEKGGFAAVTATKGYPLKIWYPLEWHEKAITITEDEAPVLYTYTLESDRTIALDNADPVHAFRIVTNSGEGSRQGPKLEYVSKDDQGRVTECVTSDYYTELPLEAGGSTTLTAGSDYNLELWLPNEWLTRSTVAIREVSHPAVYTTTIRPGYGLSVENNSRVASYLMYTDAADASSAKIDYLYKDGDRKITDCGADVIMSGIAVEIAGFSQITVKNGADLKVWLPYEWTLSDLTLREGLIRTLYTYTLPAGKSLELSNLDKNMAYSVYTNSTGSTAAPRFDYVYEDAWGDIISFGHEDINGSFDVLSGGRTTITAGSHFDLDLWFPYEWNETQLETNIASGSALYFHKIRNGRSLELHNRSQYTYTIQNSSGTSYASPKYDYIVYSIEASPVTEKERNGDIVLLPMQYIEIIAANGLDLEIWMPSQWAKNITLKE